MSPKSGLYLLLIALVGLIAWLQSRPRENTESQDPSAEFLMMSRHLVGAQAVLGEHKGDNPAGLAAQIEKLSSAPKDAPRQVVLFGELLGGPEALKQIDRLEQQAGLIDYAADFKVLRIIYEQGPDRLSPSDQNVLLKRHGWFGQLALAYGLDPYKPVRQTAMGPAMRVEITFLVMFVAGTLALMLGAALLVMGASAVTKGQMTPALPELALRFPLQNTAFLEVFVLFLGTMPLLGLMAGTLSPMIALLFQCLPLCLVTWAHKRGVSGVSLRMGLGWYTGKGVVAEVLAGLGGYLAGLPILCLGLLLTSVLAQFAHTVPTHPISEQLAGVNPIKIGYLYLMACVAAPIVEETLFRGAFFYYLRSSKGAVLAALIQGLVFAAIHPQGWAAVPVLTAIGFVCAAIREWRGSLIAPIVAHFLNNFIALTIMLLLLN